MHDDVRCRRPQCMSERIVLRTDDDKIRADLVCERDYLGPWLPRQ